MEFSHINIILNKERVIFFFSSWSQKEILSGETQFLNITISIWKGEGIGVLQRYTMPMSKLLFSHSKSHIGTMELHHFLEFNVSSDVLYVTK